jgi:hypothetical protein
VVTTAATTIMSGCETVVYTGLEPCPKCGGCLPTRKECTELATQTVAYCRRHSCPAIRRKCDDNDVETYAPTATVTEVYTSECTVFSAAGPSPCPPCLTCWRDSSEATLTLTTTPTEAP